VLNLSEQRNAFMYGAKNVLKQALGIHIDRKAILYNKCLKSFPKSTVHFHNIIQSFSHYIG